MAAAKASTVSRLPVVHPWSTPRTTEGAKWLPGVLTPRTRPPHSSPKRQVVQSKKGRPSASGAPRGVRRTRSVRKAVLPPAEASVGAFTNAGELHPPRRRRRRVLRVRSPGEASWAEGRRHGGRTPTPNTVGRPSARPGAGRDARDSTRAAGGIRSRQRRTGVPGAASRREPSANGRRPGRQAGVMARPVVMRGSWRAEAGSTGVTFRSAQRGRAVARRYLRRGSPVRLRRTLAQELALTAATTASICRLSLASSTGETNTLRTIWLILPVTYACLKD